MILRIFFACVLNIATLSPVPGSRTIVSSALGLQSFLRRSCHRLAALLGHAVTRPESGRFPAPPSSRLFCQGSRQGRQGQQAGLRRWYDGFAMPAPQGGPRATLSIILIGRARLCKPCHVPLEKLATSNILMNPNLVNKAPAGGLIGTSIVSLLP